MKWSISFFLILIGFDSMAAKNVPVLPYVEIINKYQDTLTVDYTYDGPDVGDGVPDDYGVDGKPYTEAVAMVDEVFTKPAAWWCYEFPEGTNKRYCRQTFWGGNFDSRIRYEFTFYFVKDSSGIRLETNIVEALESED